MTASVVSLCSGIGGLDLGLERAGWTIAAQVEIDPYCQRVLARHWPEVPRWDDLTTLDPATLPPADLVAAGFPCQPVSLAGRRHAQADQRWLWPHVARVVGHLRPRWILLENVPGLYSRGLGDVLGDLAALGYDAEWCCISAADVGAPHRRERIWIVAYTGGPGLEILGVQPARPQRPAAQRSGQAGRTATLGDAESLRRRRPGLGGEQRQPGCPQEPRGPDTRGAESILGGVADGLPGRVDGHRWPAPPDPDNGSPQHPWEPPRTVRARAVPYRARRVSALGNAVVPQIPELIGRTILNAHNSANVNQRLRRATEAPL